MGQRLKMYSTARPPSFCPSRYGSVTITAVPAKFTAMAAGSGKSTPAAMYKNPLYRNTLKLFTAKSATSTRAAKRGLSGV